MTLISLNNALSQDLGLDEFKLRRSLGRKSKLKKVSADAIVRVDAGASTIRGPAAKVLLNRGLARPKSD